jgi:ribulose 1,5-bisphosphate synthetase/thiazole synthase
MAERYDVIVIGAGLGGLTAAALLAHAGRKTLVIERNASVGGAASTYKVGDLMVEASLHETADQLLCPCHNSFLIYCLARCLSKYAIMTM